MSRIGKNPVVIPEGVELTLNGQDIKAKGKLGELALRIHDEVAVSIEEIASRILSTTGIERRAGR